MIKHLKCTDTDIKIIRIVLITDQLCYKNASIAHSSKYYDKHYILKIATIVISQKKKNNNNNNNNNKM